jgi:Ligated ion channel L-glutamate- and glycine-binding site
MEPYLMPNPRYVNGTDPPEYGYIGYIADLVDRLSHVIGFEYVIKPVADKSFGHQRDDGTWDGIIGELVSGVSYHTVY